MTTLRDFQRRTTEILSSQQSVLIHAPTGLGKTWATANGFVQNSDSDANNVLGTRLMHVLPMRALANSVREDISALLSANGKTGIFPTIHHGQQQESEIFAEKVCVTTVDQYFAAFAGAPLSFTNAKGHALAGAVLGSYSVFDEVHLLEPERGLPLLYAMLKQRQRWGLLSAVMTATLPTSVREFLCKDVGLEEISLSDKDVHARDGWRNVILTLTDAADAKTTTEKIIEAQQNHERVIAFVNTVDAAVELYQGLLQAKKPTCELILIHSNYAPSHRADIEKRLLKVFGKESNTPAIVVTTQVAEAGLNISAPVVFSELSPVDSLIQRAGRCSRFSSQPEGQFIVYPPKRDKAHIPYNEDLVMRTQVAFENRENTFRLDWQTEKVLVDEVLDSFYKHFVVAESVRKDDAKIKPAKKGNVTELPQPMPKVEKISINEALGIFDQAFLDRDPRNLEYTLRNIRNVQVIVSDKQRLVNGATFDNEDFGDTFESWLDKQNTLNYRERAELEGVSVSLGRFARAVQDYELEHAELVPLKEEKHIQSVHVQRAERIAPNRTYVLTSREAGYSPTLGLTFRPKLGSDKTPYEPRQSKEPPPSEHKFQTWLEHCTQVYTKASKLIDRYMPFISQAAKTIPSANDDFAEQVASLMRVAALFHDIGKLNKPWQEAIHGGTWDGSDFWGKSRKDIAVQKLPPHAFYALPCLRYLFWRLGVVSGTDGDNGVNRVDRLAELMALASARHHSLGGVDGRLTWQRFEVFPDKGTVVAAIDALLQNTLGDETALFSGINFADMLAHLNDPEYADVDGDGFHYVLDTPSPSEDYYPFYVIACRVIKVGDWEASGEKEIELCR